MSERRRRLLDNLQPVRNPRPNRAMKREVHEWSKTGRNMLWDFWELVKEFASI